MELGSRAATSTIETGSHTRQDSSTSTVHTAPNTAITPRREQKHRHDSFRIRHSGRGAEGTRPPRREQQLVQHGEDQQLEREAHAGDSSSGTWTGRRHGQPEDHGQHAACSASGGGGRGEKHRSRETPPATSQTAGTRRWYAFKKGVRPR